MLEENPLLEENTLENGVENAAENLTQPDAEPAAEKADREDISVSALTNGQPEPGVIAANVAPVESTEDDTDKHNEAQLRNVIATVLEEDAEQLSEHLKHAALQEMAMLMEELSRRPVERNNIRKVGLIKKQFDESLDKALQELNHLIEHAETSEAEKDNAKETKDRNLTYSQQLSRALVVFNKNRHEFEAKQATEREENLKIKRELLEQLKGIVMGEQVTAIDKVRTIQNKWRSIGQVTQSEADNLIQSYRTYLDQFYGLRAKYNELLEQDRKINLEEKDKLIVEMDALTASLQEVSEIEAWNAASDTVKQLHENWKHVGPVPREQSETQWNRFKASTDAFYALRRTFFDSRDEQRAGNTVKKQEVLDRMAPLLELELKSKEHWAEATGQMMALQAEWNAIGPATLYSGRELMKKFRDLLNVFFKKRAGFFDEVNAGRGALVQKKEELLAGAEAAVQETDTHIAAEKLKTLQRQWRETGPDDYKDARKVQKRFRKVCDTFFSKLKEQIAGEQKEQEENLTQKNALLEKLEAWATAGAADANELKELDDAWHAIGHVPFKQKDKVIGRYRKAMDVLRPRGQGGYSGGNRGEARGDFNRGGGNRGDFNRGERRDNRDGGSRNEGRGNYKGDRGNYEPRNAEPAMSGDEKRITGRMRQLEETITQWENNILFISKSKTSDNLRAEMTEKIEGARAEMKTLKAELKELRKPKRAPEAVTSEVIQPAASEGAPAVNSATPEPAAPESATQPDDQPVAEVTPTTEA